MPQHWGGVVIFALLLMDEALALPCTNIAPLIQTSFGYLDALSLLSRRLLLLSGHAQQRAEQLPDKLRHGSRGHRRVKVAGHLTGSI